MDKIRNSITSWKFNNKFQISSKWIIGLILIIFVVLIRLPSIVIPLQNDEGAIAYNARMILNGEPLYGSHHPGHHLPAVYYLYALIFTVSGDHPEAVKIFLIPWMLLNAALLYQIGKQLVNWKAGILAFIFFILTCSIPNLNGETAEIEQFANLPLTIIIWIVVCLPNKQKNLLPYLMIGIFGAISFLFKAVYISSILAVAATFTLEAVLERNYQSWIHLSKQLIMMFIGVFIIVGSVAVYFLAIGLWPRVYLGFQIGGSYLGQGGIPITLGLIFQYLYLTMANLSFVYLSFTGLLRRIIFLPIQISRNNQKGLSQFLIISWFIITIVISGFSGRLYGHYLLLFIPPMSLIVGMELADFFDYLNNNFGNTKLSSLKYAPYLLIFIVIANYFLFSKGYFQSYLKNIQGELTRTEFIEDNVGHQIIDAEYIANYINANTNSDDRILTWTDQAEICYMANRRSASDILWRDEISFLGPPERILETKPKFIVTDTADPKLPAWLASQIATHYQLVFALEKLSVYQRNSQ